MERDGDPCPHGLPDIDPLRLTAGSDVAGTALHDRVAMGLGMLAVGAGDRPDLRDQRCLCIVEFHKPGIALGDGLGTVVGGAYCETPARDRPEGAGA